MITDELYSLLCARGSSAEADADEAGSTDEDIPQHRQRRHNQSTAGVPETIRFHLVPRVGWDGPLRKLRCGARNILKQKDGEWTPEAPHSTWLLPASDEVAVQIAQQQARLRALGWRLLTCEASVVLQLGNKAMLQDYAAQHGLLAHLPQHYASPDAARYPCILKSATGEYGKNNHIVRCEDEVLRVASQGFGSQWVLQELILGCREYSVSLLVDRGRILDSIGTVYECDREAYVWPHVRRIKKDVHPASDGELSVMRGFLPEYTGICNFNYKIRPCGRLSIFEINTRVGGDLACDAPKRRARQLFELLDTLSAGAVPAELTPGPEGCQRPRHCPDGLPPRFSSGEWDDPLVIQPRDNVHRYTLVYLHPFRIGLRDYVRKMGLFSSDSLRIVMPHAPKRRITCLGGQPMPSWYDYLTDHKGQEEDEVDECSLTDTRQHVSELLDKERQLIRESVEGAVGDGGGRLLIGGCSQGCGAALDVALRYPTSLLGFVGIVGHPLSVTPLGKHCAMPLHFFNGAKDKVMRWQWVEGLIEGLRRAGHSGVASHGPAPQVHHGVGREFEASCVHTAVSEILGSRTTE